MHRLTVLVAALAALLIATSASAASFTVVVTADGAQEGVITPATGTATLILDDVANTLDVSMTFTGLLTPTNNAHIHCCSQPPVPSPVIIPWVPSGFPIGVQAGAFNFGFNLTPAQVAQIKSGDSYINIHTTGFPGGEIRGQIPFIPEPGTLSLLSVGLAGLVAIRRNARR